MTKILREFLIPLLVEKGEVDYVIKREDSYPCISTTHFKILDIVNYLAPGISYDGFLKAYGTSMLKSYFPYEFFDSVEKLNMKSFPPYNAFFSTLKCCNTLEPKHDETLLPEELKMIGKNDSYVTLTVDEIKTIGEYRYHTLCKMFYEKGWSFREYLILYNNR